LADLEILRLTGETRLPRARVLSEYEGIVVDPRFAPLFDFSDRLEPGSVTEANYSSTVTDAAAELDKRRKELKPFFELGGIVVVYGYAETILFADERPMYNESRRTTAHTHRWLYEHLQPPPRQLKPGERLPFPSNEAPEPWLRPARGEYVRVVEPGHALAHYLEGVRSYEALFARYVREWSNATILAENRASEPIAVEFAAGRGSIIVIPPPSDSPSRDRLNEMVLQLIRERVSVGREWHLTAEVELDAEERATALRHAEDRRQLGDRRAFVRSVKAQLFDEVMTKRVIAYWDRVTAAGATHEQALQQLYKLIEVLEDRYGGERGLPEALGIDRAKLKAVKRLANNYDIRHAGDDPGLLPPPNFNDAIAFGRELVQAFLERRAREVSSAPTANSI
jgi:hypothetical protein